jgi:aromatic-L-amino-acid/L-tryptophan decarboxylase
MMNTNEYVPEESLDPADWEAVQELGVQMVTDMLEYLKTVRERPVWQPIPEEIKEHFHKPLPLEPEAAERVYQDFKENVLPYPLGNIHPRFWGWVIGTGTPLGVLAEMLAATMNPNTGGGEQAATYVESQVLNWCKEMTGFPLDSSGLLVSGGSMANLVGLTVARHAKANYDIRSQGLYGSPSRMIFYGSKEMHSSLQKAVELLGFGSQSLRMIPVNEEFQIDLEELRNAIREDRERGHLPICIIGNAGTVNTGAVDELNALADICQVENLWFHVDGAFGALARLDPTLRNLLTGMERADSLAFDLHKWMYMPYEIGCALVRREEDHRRAFSLTPDYLAHAERGMASGDVWFSEYGVQLSRGFRALKAWMSIKEHGILKYGRMVRQNVDQASYLADLVDRAPELERLAPAPLNIVCFRYRIEGLHDEALNELNKELLIRLQESGSAAPSYTTLNGKYAIRAAISNQRSRREDFDILVREVIRIGNEMVQESNGQDLIRWESKSLNEA